MTERTGADLWFLVPWALGKISQTVPPHVFRYADSRYFLLFPHPLLGGTVAQRVEVVCSIPILVRKLRTNLRQVVHTYVPLSPSSITWYRPRGSDALRLGR